MFPAICPLNVNKSVMILNRDFKDWVIFIMDLLPFMFIMELLPFLRWIYHPPSQPFMYSVCFNDHKWNIKAFTCGTRTNDWVFTPFVSIKWRRFPLLTQIIVKIYAALVEISQNIAFLLSPIFLLEFNEMIFLLAFIIIWYSITACYAQYAMMSIARAQRAVEAMLELHWVRAGIFWRRMFFSKIAYLYIVGTRPPRTIGAVIGSGNDELQCRPIPAESAGGFRADPEDRKRHLRRCVQGKTAAMNATAEVHYRTDLLCVVLLHSSPLLNE